MRATPGSIGGAASDAGVEYRRAAAAYAVAYGLAGLPLQGFGPPPALAHVASVALETDDPVDDIRVEFASGTTSYIQAKIRLEKGPPFNKAVEQWVSAAQRGIRPTDRLVICSGSISKSLQRLQRALDRLKTEQPGGPTAFEGGELAYLDNLLRDLSDEQRHQVKRVASIHRLDVAEMHLMHARETILLLALVVGPEKATDAWVDLVRIAGITARRRGGYSIGGWLRELRDAGYAINSEASTAAHLEQRFQATSRYLERIARRGRQLSLRKMGAPLPPLALTDADADVRVLLDSQDSRTGAEPIWAFLRHGRAILTGLPGGGKSTAMESLAARLTHFADTSLPVLTSLKDVEEYDHTTGFQERMINSAVRELPPSDRELVREEIEERLQRGGLTLLLDSLDETYERRAQVVEEIDEFLRARSPDIDVLIATRDAAYAHAATLGWKELRLASPENIARTVEVVLRRTAELHLATQRTIANVETWIADRLSWVERAIEENKILGETPLLPVLLALLAAERDETELPQTRGAILKTAISDIVEREKLSRAEAFALGDLEGDAAANAALEAFSVEASVIMDRGGHCSYDDVVAAVEAAFEARWELGAGNAHVAAVRTVRFWDENGIFFASGASASIKPRLMLFAEIGDAIAAVRKDEGQLRQWVEQRVDTGNIESLVLAANLSDLAAQDLARCASRDGDRELLNATVRAFDEGANLSDHLLRSTLAGLLRDTAHGDREGWKSWTATLKLPTSVLDVPSLVEALSVFPDPHQVVGRALVELRCTPTEHLVDDPGPLLDVLSIHHLDTLPSRSNQRASLLDSVLVDANLIVAVRGAASALVSSVEEAPQLIVDQYKNAPRILRDDLAALLRNNGYSRELEQAQADDTDFPRSSRLMEAMSDYDLEAAQKLLTHMASGQPSSLTYAQAVRLDELADMLETVRINDAATHFWHRHQALVPDIVELIATLGSFRLDIISAQAEVTLKRMEVADRDNAPFFALLDGASTRELSNWDAVADREVAVKLLVRMLTWGLGDARVAASALWESPVADIAAPRIRHLIPRLSSVPRHQRIAGHLLCSLNDGDERDAWIDADSPVLRGVAAIWCNSGDEGAVSASLRTLLFDSDGNVRIEALRHLSGLEMSDRVELLQQISEQGNPGWMCLYCRAQNRPGIRFCSSCNFGGPDPARAALNILSGVSINE